MKVKLQNIEKWFFYLFALFNLLPLLLFKTFPTLDGAAHLYNANIIKNLLEKNELFQSFFIINPELIPNWMGHILLLVLNFAFSPILSEKILQIGIIFLTAYSFRQLISVISKENIVVSYFIFPFTYSFTFILGFYNFSIAVVFMFFTIAFFIKHNFKNFTTIVILSILFLATYFSHIFIFGITLLICGLLIFAQAIFDNKTKQGFSQFLQTFIKKLSVLILSSFIPLGLLIHYFITRIGSETQVTFIPTEELINWLKNIRSIIALHFLEEGKYTEKIAYVLFGLTFIGIVKRKITAFQVLKENNWKIKEVYQKNDIWYISLLIIIFLYFFLPDSDGNAGYVSTRLNYLIFIYLIIWVSTFKISKWILYISALAILFFTIKLNNYYISQYKNFNSTAKECLQQATLIENNTIVLPINVSNNWFYSHFSNYLAIEKNIILMENYEAATGYFPINWNYENMPYMKIGSMSIEDFDCLYWKTNHKKTSDVFEYIFILGNINDKSEKCWTDVIELLNNEYKLINTTEKTSLYKIIKTT